MAAVELNEEGIVTSGRNRQQFTFDGSTIHDLLTTAPMAPSGAVVPLPCLAAPALLLS
jgi:thiamine biosynthesis lipoprotein ApbE